MPTYCHICTNKKCNNEWEDDYSIKADPPKQCPKCKKDTAKRVISGGSGRGIVELTGRELKEHLVSEGNKLKMEMYQSEKKYASFLGDDKYQNIQSGMDKYRK